MKHIIKRTFLLIGVVALSGKRRQREEQQIAVTLLQPKLSNVDGQDYIAPFSNRLQRVSTRRAGEGGGGGGRGGTCVRVHPAKRGKHE